jgi:alpha-glucoside transport system permease protein
VTTATATPLASPAPAIPPDPGPQRTRSWISRFRPSRIVVNIVLGAIALFWLMPSLSMLIISFRPAGLFEISGWWKAFTTPSQLTLQNYKELFVGGNSTVLGGGVPSGLAPGSVLDSLRTSLEISIPATILVTLIASLTAYSLVFGRWRGRNIVFLTIVGLMVVPLQVALIPVASLYKDLGSAIGWNPFGTVSGVVMFHVAFGLPFGIFLMRNFFTGIPTALIEAGRIDGAGEWTLFRRVVIPLAVAAAASLAIFQFIWVWNDLLVALVFLGGSPHVPLTLFLYNQERTLAANFWIISTGSMVSIIVPLIVFLSFQRYFVRGMLAGAVK